MFDTKFNLIVSIGGNCACAMYLNELGIRMRSYPFDWLSWASFGQRIDTLCGRFAGFLEKQNVAWYGPGTGDNANDVYLDGVTGYRFVHDFPKGMTYDEAYPLVRAKYDRRIARLLDELDRGISVCLVWWSVDMHPTDAECSAAIERVRQTFPKSDCRLLVFENDMACSSGHVEERPLSEHCLKVVGCIAPEGSGVLGLQKTNRRIFRRLRMGPALAAEQRRHDARRALVHLLTFWHLDRAARKRARAFWKARLGGGGQGKKIGW